MNKLIAVLLLVLLSSCASTTQFDTYPRLVTATADTALIHVFRANSAWGSAISAPVYVDRQLVGQVGPTGALKIRVPAGEVHVASTTGDVLVEARPQSVHYVEVSMPHQLWLSRPDFEVSEVDKLRAADVLGYEPD